MKKIKKWAGKALPGSRVPTGKCKRNDGIRNLPLIIILVINNLGKNR